MPWSVSAAAVAQLPASHVLRAGVETAAAFEDLMKGKLWSVGSQGRLPSSGDWLTDCCSHMGAAPAQLGWVLTAGEVFRCW